MDIISHQSLSYTHTFPPSCIWLSTFIIPLVSVPLFVKMQVVDIFLRDWPGKIVLCAPLYADAYENDSSTAPRCACKITADSVVQGTYSSS